MPGPAPKRDSARRRTNTKAAQKAEQFLPEKLGPDLPEDLGISADSIGGRFYESLRTSGQAVFYADSDWIVALFVAQAMNDYREFHNGQILTAINRYMGQLLATEGDRRSARLELERQTEEDPAHLAAVSDFEAMRKKFSG